MNSWKYFDDDVLDDFLDDFIDGDRLEVVQEWVGKSGTPNVVFADAISLISHVAGKDLKCLRFLLELGADPNGSPVELAIESPLVTGLRSGENRQLVFDLLLEANADINCRRGELGCPLIDCLWDGDVKITKLLLSRGCDPQFGGKDGEGKPNIRKPDTVAADVQKQLAEVFMQHGYDLPEG